MTTYEYDRGLITLKKGIYSFEMLKIIITELKMLEGPAYMSAVDVCVYSGYEIESEVGSYGLDRNSTDRMLALLKHPPVMTDICRKPHYVQNDGATYKVCGLEAIAAKLEFIEIDNKNN